MFDNFKSLEESRLVFLSGELDHPLEITPQIPPQKRPRPSPTYILNLWPQLGLYLTDGRIEIDQNLVENAIRPTALGKKNWLFIGSAEAGQRSAILTPSSNVAAVVPLILTPRK